MVCVPVTCADAGEAKNNAKPAISSGLPKRPVGCLALKASSPDLRIPKAVILLGKRLNRANQLSDEWNRGLVAEEYTPGQDSVHTVIEEGDGFSVMVERECSVEGHT